MTQIMFFLLVILNVALIIAVIVILGSRKERREKNTAAELEELNLIEFQQNLKDLIEQLKAAGDLSVEKTALAKEKLETILSDAEKAAKELRYLIDRTRMMREAEYKTEMGKPAREIPKKNTKIESEPAREKQPETKFEMPEISEPVNTMARDGSKSEWVQGLLKNGISPEEISVITGISRGEIELIKNLKK